MDDARIAQTVKGLLRMCSPHPERAAAGTRIRAVWVTSTGLLLQRATGGPRLYTDWHTAERIALARRIDWDALGADPFAVADERERRRVRRIKQALREQRRRQGKAQWKKTTVSPAGRSSK